MYRLKVVLHLLIFVAAFTAMAGIPATARADLGALVPAYFRPGEGDPGVVGGGWAAMTAAASKIPITAILNPNSGPLTGPGSGPVNQAYANAITKLENAGGKVVAYVYTDNGNAPSPRSTA